MIAGALCASDHTHRFPSKTGSAVYCGSPALHVSHNGIIFVENGREMSDNYQKTREEQSPPKHQGNMPGHDRPPRRIDVSIVIPLYNEEQSLMPLSLSVRDALDRMNSTYEVIFVDDGSTDNSLRVLKEIHRKNRRYKFISFRKNYGKSAALSVGFQHALGRIIVTMDADLQDDPNEIPWLI